MIEKRFIFLCLIVACKAQIPFLGSCPAIVPKQNFEPSRYLGDWYEAEKYFAIFQAGGKCVKAKYSAKSPGVIGVFNQQLNSFTDAPRTITGTATSAGQPDDARLTVVFPSSPFPAPYWVLETDYDNFAVVYSCNNLVVLNFKFVWLLTRARTPSKDIMQKAFDVLDKNGIPRAFLLRTDQKNCPANH